MRIVFMGTPAAAAVSLQRLLCDGHEIAAVYTQPDRPKGRGQKLAVSPVKEFALQHGLRVIQPTKIKTDETLEEFRSHSADVVVVVAYGRILPARFLTSYPLGAINVHFSLLPKYRGSAPVNWAIVNGEQTTGVTTMQMDEGLDSGDILLQEKTDIAEGENAIELMARLSRTGADLLFETLTNIKSITPRSQDNELASFAPMLKRSDGVIGWDRPAVEIVRRIRGLQPFPMAFTFYEGKRLTIWNAHPYEDFHAGGEEPGTLSVEAGRLSVKCGDDTFLWLDELQFEGKKRMLVKDFLNGAPLKSGETFGN